MSDKNQVRIDLIADPKGVKPGYDQALAEQSRFKQRFDEQEKAAETERNRRWQAYQEKLKQSKESQAEVNRQAEAFVEKLKDQAATLGLSGTKLQAYRADQMALTAAQKESVLASLQQIDAFERKQAALARLATDRKSTV